MQQFQLVCLSFATIYLLPTDNRLLSQCPVKLMCIGIYVILYYAKFVAMSATSAFLGYYMRNCLAFFFCFALFFSKSFPDSSDLRRRAFSIAHPKGSIWTLQSQLCVCVCVCVCKRERGVGVQYFKIYLFKLKILQIYTVLLVILFFFYWIHW